MIDAALDAANGVCGTTASLLECFVPAQLRHILLHDLHGGFVFVELVSRMRLHCGRNDRNRSGNAKAAGSARREGRQGDAKRKVKRGE
jgi:hypothetical protein